MTLTIDIWCNPSYGQMPQDAQILTVMDEEPTDPCNVYVSMEHADGCIFWDMRPLMKILGCCMIGCGAILMIQGMTYQKLFMRLLVRLAVLMICFIVFYKLHFFDPIDPTVLSKRGAMAGYTLIFFCIIIAFVAQYIVGIVFRKSLRFGPTLLGGMAGWWFAIYFIIGVNGFFGAFADQGAKDMISPVWSWVLEIMGAIFGGTIGNCYSYIFILAIQTCISSYLIMRGCTLISNWGYPNEVVMMEAASSETNNLIHLGWMFYFYILWWLAMWAAALKYQLEKAFDEGGNRYLDDSEDN